MSADWKPGDVALIGFSHYVPVPALFVSTRQRWVDIDGAEFDGDEADLTIRPLVVIDPEDREQMERLLDAHNNATQDAACKGGECGSGSCWIDIMRNALREFANPKPPKPEEPTGLGAVVVDGVERWVRVDPARAGWCVSGGGTRDFRCWQDFSPAVRVLSEGVQA